MTEEQDSASVGFNGVVLRPAAVAGLPGKRLHQDTGKRCLSAQVGRPVPREDSFEHRALRSARQERCGNSFAVVV